MLALEVKNAFKSANWNGIRGALVGIGIFGYLHLREDSLVRQMTDEGPKEYVAKTGFSPAVECYV